MGNFSVKNLTCMTELHLHLDGSLSLSTVKELAAMQHMDIPKTDEELVSLLSVSDGCRDLNEYLDKFDFAVSLLQTKESLTTAAYRFVEELQAQGLMYAEICFAPQKHTQRGLTQEEVICAVLEGMRKSSFKSNLIICCMRGDDNHEENMETAKLAVKYRGKGVVALNLAGAEALFKTAMFEDLFSLARENGVAATIHAGEADGPDSVWKALEFGAVRIGHGVRSIEDEKLIKVLAEKGVALEMCPTSNLNTVVVKDLKDWPIVPFMKAGICVTLNTDNMTVSNTTIKKEFQMVIDTFSLTKEDVKLLLLNSVRASLADAETKAWMREKVEKEFA